MKSKTLRLIIALATASPLIGCTNIPIDGETPTEINWWLTAAFCFIWLFFSCPIIPDFISKMSGGEGYSGDEDLSEASYKIAGTSVYAFPVMLFMSSQLNKFLEWPTNYLICIVVGFIIGAIIRKQRDPLCNELIHQTKWLWIGLCVMTIISIILALTV